jgi:hypothetical protein
MKAKIVLLGKYTGLKLFLPQKRFLYAQTLPASSAANRLEKVISASSSTVPE